MSSIQVCTDQNQSKYTVPNLQMSLPPLPLVPKLIFKKKKNQLNEQWNVHIETLAHSEATDNCFNVKCYNNFQFH